MKEQRSDIARGALISSELAVNAHNLSREHSTGNERTELMHRESQEWSTELTAVGGIAVMQVVAGIAPWTGSGDREEL
jgi:hypothetical protein